MENQIFSSLLYCVFTVVVTVLYTITVMIQFWSLYVMYSDQSDATFDAQANVEIIDESKNLIKSYREEVQKF